MKLAERRSMILSAINFMKHKVIIYKLCEYEGSLTREERDEEISKLQRHIVAAQGALTMIESLIADQVSIA